MSDITTTVAPAAAIAKAPEPKNVRDDMDSRRILPNAEEATAYLAKCMADFADFNSYPVAAPGLSVNAETNALVFDPEVYSDGTAIMVSVLTQRAEEEGARSSVKAIVIAPVPTFSAILANPEGAAWMQRIVEKELNHVAVRQLRKAEDIAEAVDSMPKTLTDYISSDRGTGGILQAYEELWRPIKNNMGKLSRSWKLMNLSKKELRRALESSAYASEYYPTLEESKQGSLFVFALNGLIDHAKKNGFDPTIFERWLSGRNEKVIDAKAEDDEEEFSLDDLTSAMAAPAPALTRNEGESDEDFAKRQAEHDAANPPAPAATDEVQVAPTPEPVTEPIVDETAEMTDAELEAATAPPASEPVEPAATETPAPQG